MSIDFFNTMKEIFNHSKNLKDVRYSLNLTQLELANALQEKQARIRDIEAGKQKIPIEIAVKIEKIYHVNFRWLLTGEGTMYGETPPTVSSFNYDILERITIMVENYLSDADIVMSPKKKAKLLVILCKLHSDNVNNLSYDIIKNMCELTQNND